MPMRQPAYFYPRSPCGERPLTTCKYACKPEFLSTLSLRRATSPHRPAPASVRISIHALLAESDNTLFPNVKEVEYFYPRSPCGERPPKHEVCRGGINFYPRSPCGERPVRVVRTCWSPYFYPRSPCGERHGQDVLLPAALEFLSTLSLRRATIGGSTNQTHKINFYPRSPCGERPEHPLGKGSLTYISIHALLAESDYDTSSLMQCQAKFLSTLSLRRATRLFLINQHLIDNFYPRSPCGERPLSQSSQKSTPEISIHALLAESDETFIILTKQLNNFYPRSPCGERRHPKTSNHPHNTNFYPRSPCGERRGTLSDTSDVTTISIHALLAESDQKLHQARHMQNISIHALLAESDTRTQSQSLSA